MTRRQTAAKNETCSVANIMTTAIRFDSEYQNAIARDFAESLQHNDRLRRGTTDTPLASALFHSLHHSLTRVQQPSDTTPKPPDDQPTVEPALGHSHHHQSRNSPVPALTDVRHFGPHCLAVS